MSTLTPIEKEHFEKMFQMESGYVLDITNPKYAELFARHNVNIDAPHYSSRGDSKAKRMRFFGTLSRILLSLRCLRKYLNLRRPKRSCISKILTWNYINNVAILFVDCRASLSWKVKVVTTS